MKQLNEKKVKKYNSLLKLLGGVGDIPKTEIANIFLDEVKRLGMEEKKIIADTLKNS